MRAKKKGNLEQAIERTLNIEEKLDIQMCKACGEQMEERLCREHMQKTGHDEFRPIFDNQNMKGGIKK